MRTRIEGEHRRRSTRREPGAVSCERCRGLGRSAALSRGCGCGGGGRCLSAVHKVPERSGRSCGGRPDARRCTATTAYGESLRHRHLRTARVGKLELSLLVLSSPSAREPSFSPFLRLVNRRREFTPLQSVESVASRRASSSLSPRDKGCRSCQSPRVSSLDTSNACCSA